MRIILKLRQDWARLCLLLFLCLGCPLALARHHHRNDRAEGVPGQFDYYLLSLSWSPTYCLTHGADQAQCDSKGLGFVLHGLWPQYNSGGYPMDCAAEAALPANAMAVGRADYPSPALMTHEWIHHGTCSGLDAQGYFRAADRALGTVRIPATFETPSTVARMSSRQIRAQFQAANPTLPEDGIVMICSRGELSEIRVCLSRDLVLRSCGRGVRSSCPTASIAVPSSR